MLASKKEMTEVGMATLREIAISGLNPPPEDKVQLGPFETWLRAVCRYIAGPKHAQEVAHFLTTHPFDTGLIFEYSSESPLKNGVILRDIIERAERKDVEGRNALRLGAAATLSWDAIKQLSPEISLIPYRLVWGHIFFGEQQQSCVWEFLGRHPERLEGWIDLIMAVLPQLTVNDARQGLPHVWSLCEKHLAQLSPDKQQQLLDKAAPGYEAIFGQPVTGALIWAAGCQTVRDAFAWKEVEMEIAARKAVSAYLKDVCQVPENEVSAPGALERFQEASGVPWGEFESLYSPENFTKIVAPRLRQAVAAKLGVSEQEVEAHKPSPRSLMTILWYKVNPLETPQTWTDAKVVQAALKELTASAGVHPLGLRDRLSHTGVKEPGLLAITLRSFLPDGFANDPQALPIMARVFADLHPESALYNLNQAAGRRPAEGNRALMGDLHALDRLHEKLGLTEELAAVSRENRLHLWVTVSGETQSISSADLWKTHRAVIQNVFAGYYEKYGKPPLPDEPVGSKIPTQAESLRRVLNEAYDQFLDYDGAVRAHPDLVPLWDKLWVSSSLSWAERGSRIREFLNDLPSKGTAILEDPFLLKEELQWPTRFTRRALSQLLESKRGGGPIRGPDSALGFETDPRRILWGPREISEAINWMDTPGRPPGQPVDLAVSRVFSALMGLLDYFPPGTTVKALGEALQTLKKEQRLGEISDLLLTQFVLVESPALTGSGGPYWMWSATAWLDSEGRNADVRAIVTQYQVFRDLGRIVQQNRDESRNALPSLWEFPLSSTAATPTKWEFPAEFWEFPTGKTEFVVAPPVSFVAQSGRLPTDRPNEPAAIWSYTGETVQRMLEERREAIRAIRASLQPKPSLTSDIQEAITSGASTGIATALTKKIREAIQAKFKLPAFFKTRIGEAALDLMGPLGLLGLTYIAPDKVPGLDKVRAGLKLAISGASTMHLVGLVDSAGSLFKIIGEEAPVAKSEERVMKLLPEPSPVELDSWQQNQADQMFGEISSKPLVKNSRS